MLARFASCALAALGLVGAAYAGSGWSNTFPPAEGLNGAKPSGRPRGSGGQL